MNNFETHTIGRCKSCHKFFNYKKMITLKWRCPHCDTAFVFTAKYNPSSFLMVEPIDFEPIDFMASGVFIKGTAFNEEQ